ncbi:flagellar biosynthetic protein FliO [Candidatus Sumerlaeota bacterium]|nr:flagellar biosynthetic protein FliO [Candidatus Sumerlaeota bacterium]
MNSNISSIRSIFCWLAIAGMLALHAAGAADEAAPVDDAKPLSLSVQTPEAGIVEPPDVASSLGRMTMAMGAVLALIGLTAAIGKRWLKNGGSALLTGRVGEAETIRIVARKPLGGKQSLLLVQAGEALLLVGRSAQTMTTLARLDRPGESEAAEDAFDLAFSGEAPERTEPAGALACGEFAEALSGELQRSR